MSATWTRTHTTETVYRLTFSGDVTVDDLRCILDEHEGQDHVVLLSPNVLVIREPREPESFDTDPPAVLPARGPRSGQGGNR